ncbi:hypothetical protein AB4571_02170 [Vibrio breoganii]
MEQNQEQKHIVEVVAGDVIREGDRRPTVYVVPVYWRVELCEETLSYLGSKRNKHYPEDIKTGVGRLDVLVSRKVVSEEDMPAYAEAVAAVYLYHQAGVNVFGMDRESGRPPKIATQLALSQPLARSLVAKDPYETKALQRDGKSYLLAHFDFAAAYFYGVSIGSSDPDSGWVKEGQRDEDGLSAFGRVSGNYVRRRLNIDTDLGRLKITYRTVEEFFAMPLVKELIEVKGQVYARPYESVHEQVLKATKHVESDNPHLVKLRNKFGKKAKSLLSENPPTFVDLIPTAARPTTFIVLGFRPLYAEETATRLIKKGFALFG